jgi:hypothetical protein
VQYTTTFVWLDLLELAASGLDRFLHDYLLATAAVTRLTVSSVHVLSVDEGARACSRLSRIRLSTPR